MERKGIELILLFRKWNEMKQINFCVQKTEQNKEQKNLLFLNYKTFRIQIIYVQIEKRKQNAHADVMKYVHNSI